MTDDPTKPPNNPGPSDGDGGGEDESGGEGAPGLDRDELERMGELERLEALSERPDSTADQVSADQLSLTRRLRQPRTIVSIILPLVLLVLFARALPGFNLEELPTYFEEANKALLLAAFIVFYLGFPLRGLRWSILIRGTGFRLKVRDSTEIILISWLVNCLVPAKLGDVYRAYLLKINSPVSLSRTFGTVFIERILDLFAIVVLGLAFGFISFRKGLPPQVQVVFAIGVIVVIVLAIGLLSMRNFGRRIITRLPLPHSVVELYDRFEEGVFSATTLRALPGLVVLTGLIWTTEALRLYFVILALGFPDVHLGLSGVFFVALTGSLLTAVPFTPAGIGVVEAGVVGVLTLIYNVPPTEALAIVLMDRLISVLSVIFFGSIAYVVSPVRKGRGIVEAGAPQAEPTG
jgi:glycosyltransferase 2 family protein